MRFFLGAALTLSLVATQALAAETVTPSAPDKNAQIAALAPGKPAGVLPAQRGRFGRVLVLSGIGVGIGAVVALSLSNGHNSTYQTVTTN